MQTGGADAVAALHAALDALAAVDLGGLADADLLDLVRDTEVLARRMAPVQQLQTAEVDRRGLARERGCATTGVLLSQLLRLGSGEARARVRTADDLAPRRSFTGEVLPPLHPVVAAAQVGGEISTRHATLIISTIDKLPLAVDVGDRIAELETFLVDQARQFNPDDLAKICRHLLDVIDPDGTLSRRPPSPAGADETARRDRVRHLRRHRRIRRTVGHPARRVRRPETRH